MCSLLALSLIIQTDRQVRLKAHAMFGKYVAIPAFVGHIVTVCRITWRNPVNQSWVITTQYWATVVECVCLVALALLYIRKAKTASNLTEKNKFVGMHVVRMFMAFSQSIFGSGSIRLTAWILWLTGKFFS